MTEPMTAEQKFKRDWLAQFEKDGIKVWEVGKKVGHLVFLYTFKVSGELHVAIAPISTRKDGSMRWRLRHGFLSADGKREPIKDIITFPASEVDDLFKAVVEIAGKIPGAVVKSLPTKKEIDIVKAKADDEELTRRLRILGIR